MQHYDAIGQTIAMAKRYCQKAALALSAFDPSLARSAMLDIADFCASREY